MGFRITIIAVERYFYSLMYYVSWQLCNTIRLYGPLGVSACHPSQIIVFDGRSSRNWSLRVGFSVTSSLIDNQHVTYLHGLVNSRIKAAYGGADLRRLKAGSDCIMCTIASYLPSIALNMHESLRSHCMLPS